MELYKVDVWVKENEWRTFLVVERSSVDAMDKALGEIEEEEIIDVNATKITEVDGYKIIVQ